jgi:parallel beta-helix repeat protein
MIIGASGMALLVGLVVTATPAAATTVSCGQVITASTTVSNDLFCPTGDGLVIRGNGITLNLNGHMIMGELLTHTTTQPTGLGDNGVVGAPYVVTFAKGQFAGIRVQGARDSVVGPGRVMRFAAGVVLEGGDHHVVRNVTVQDNLGPPNSEELGDGIILDQTTDSTITGNTVRNNGPFDGIGLLGSAGRNLIQGNAVIDNKMPEICPDYDVFRFSISGGGIILFCGPSDPVKKPFTFVNEQDQGIKLEGQGPEGTHNNVVAGNTVTGNGNAGVLVPAQCPDHGPGNECPGLPNRDNVIRNNAVNANGFGYPAGTNTLRVFEGTNNGGSGIVLLMGGPNPPVRHTISGNTVNGNAANGIAILPHRPGIGSTNNTIVGNVALHNNAAPVLGGMPTFNGYDGNANVTPATPCDHNVWRGNYFGSTAADIGPPAPPANLTNNPCVGPQLPVTAGQVRAAAQDPVQSQPQGEPASLSRKKMDAPAPPR